MIFKIYFPHYFSHLVSEGNTACPETTATVAHTAEPTTTPENLFSTIKFSEATTADDLPTTVLPETTTPENLPTAVPFAESTTSEKLHTTQPFSESMIHFDYFSLNI